MKHVYVVVDTNDADYVGKIVEVSEETLEHFKPLIEKIKNFKPYCNEGWSHHSNFPVGDCLREDLGEKHPMELYNLTEEEYEYFVDAFRLYGGEWGFHTITKIQEVALGEKLL
jgi:hypothetical protein